MGRHLFYGLRRPAFLLDGPFWKRIFILKRKIVFALVVSVCGLSGCANLVNPVPVAGRQQTAKQKNAQKHQNGAETFLSEVI